MEVEVRRIDHFGIVAGTIKDLGIIELIDELLGCEKQQEISSGEAVAGMILNGLGFISRPLMLTPQFFENKALECLLRKGIRADHFNRHKLGRVFDTISDYGCEKLFNTIALNVCEKDGVDMRFGHADTTTYSLTGDYDSDTDTERISVTYGHSKDLRPDLKQIVQELVTSNDGGIPFITKAWSGNASDSIILRERATKLMEEFGKTKNRYFVADSKLYASETAKTLDQINFITRVPSTIKREHEIISEALQNTNAWLTIEKGYKLQEFSVGLYDIKRQRWIVVYSEQAAKRVKQTLDKEIVRENDRIKKELFHLKAQQFACQADAEKRLKLLAKKWKYHQISDVQVGQIKCYKSRGRPKAGATPHNMWQISAQCVFNQHTYDKVLAQRSCFIIATNVPEEILNAPDTLAGYKGQDKTEKGFAFLKGHDFFTASLFLKKPARIDALLMIMVLSLLVYSIVQRRLRMKLASLKSTLPNQINKPTATPTMRWIFQLFEGVNYVTVMIGENKQTLVEGLNCLRVSILSLLCPAIQKIYQTSCTGG